MYVRSSLIVSLTQPTISMPVAMPSSQINSRPTNERTNITIPRKNSPTVHLYTTWCTSFPFIPSVCPAKSAQQLQHFSDTNKVNYNWIVLLLFSWSFRNFLSFCCSEKIPIAYDCIRSSSSFLANKNSKQEEAVKNIIFSMLYTAHKNIGQRIRWRPSSIIKLIKN